MPLLKISPPKLLDRSFASYIDRCNVQHPIPACNSIVHGQDCSAKASENEFKTE